MVRIIPKQHALANGTYTLMDIVYTLVNSTGIDPETNSATTREDAGYEAAVYFYGPGLKEEGASVRRIDFDFEGRAALQISGLAVDYSQLKDAVHEAALGSGLQNDLIALFGGYDWQFNFATANTNVYSLFGTGGDDNFTTGSGRDILQMDGGGDLVKLGGGRDTIYGSNELGFVAKGHSVIDAGGGVDILFAQSENGPLSRGAYIDLGGKSKFVVDGIAYTAKFKDVEIVVGSTLNDTIIGLRVADTLDGGAGDDTIIGGRGADRLYGNLGADDFVYLNVRDSLPGVKRRDFIGDFEKGVDDIDLSALHPDTRNDRFVFIGEAKFHGKAGELRYDIRDNPGTFKDFTLVQADLDGDGKADFEIGLGSMTSLGKGDFLL